MTNSRHRYLPINLVTEGMVLADDLLDKVGHVLLPAGAQLTAKMLAAMVNHDVQQLSVVMEALSENEQQIQSEQKIGRVQHLFRLEGQTAPASSLMAYVLHYRSGDL